jgi:hypothetical protein
VTHDRHDATHRHDDNAQETAGESLHLIEEPLPRLSWPKDRPASIDRISPSVSGCANRNPCPKSQPISRRASHCMVVALAMTVILLVIGHGGGNVALRRLKIPDSRDPVPEMTRLLNAALTMPSVMMPGT